MKPLIISAFITFHLLLGSWATVAASKMTLDTQHNIEVTLNRFYGGN